MEVVKYRQDHNPCPSMSTDSKFQRRTIQIIVSVSIFSGMLLLLFSTLLVPLCFHSFGSFHFPAYFVELQSLIYTPSKNYMFLLCNGILVIIVRSSGLIETGPSGVAPSGPQTPRIDPRFDGHGGDISDGLMETERRRRTRTDAEEKLPVAVKGESLTQTDEVQEQGSELAITVPSRDDYDYDDEIEDELRRDERSITEQAIQEQPSELRMIIDGAVNDDDDNGDDGEAQGELSIEELNRKCDEFIKKMKGELFDVEIF